MVLLCSGLAALPLKNLWASSGTEGASFLDIPVGATPTGLGSAYTAIANDAYAPVWNPAGLGQLDSVQVTGTHLSYLESLHYEFLSAAIPFHGSDEGIGASVQYLGSGNIDGRDNVGNATGNFSSTFAAYSLAYGHKISDGLSLGVTGKAITESISDASADAYAVDLGGLYRKDEHWAFGSTLTNVGTAIKFVNQSDPLPLAFHLGTVYDPTLSWRLALEGVYRESGLASAQMGVEWKYADMFSIRGGYNTSHVQGLSGGSGITAGLSLFFMGQEFSYAWTPYGDLGNTNYFSLTFRFGSTKLNSRSARSSTDDVNMESSEAEPTTHARAKSPEESEDYNNIYDVLTDNERSSLKKMNNEDTGK